ncbi:NAD(P)-dependent glycerol-1-phosphate dehydrogenase, partial [Sulfolobus sp. A20-N-F6]
MEISGTTRVAAGAEHLISFALENISEKGLHGEYCGIGTIIVSYLQRGYNYSKRVRKLLEKVNAPVTADQLGLN